MTYGLGVDLGTTFSAAAIKRGGRTEIFSLGTRSHSTPSVVVVRPDGEILVGEAAERRAISEPARAAREFKRRLGDPTPMLLGGTPYGAEALMAHVLRHVVERVTEREGEAPDRIVLSHPANYGPYKLDLLRETVLLADVGDVTFIAEPEAAAIHYASQERLESGLLLLVYDFGGGTFDAAVLRTTESGFDLVGSPEGMERLGGIDFDQAVFAHVNETLGSSLAELDLSDATALAAVARLRDDCRAAKEALSSDTDVTIRVLLPNVQTEVRLTRGEFEDMIRPRVAETIASLQRAIRSAGAVTDDLARILLVGGSSRIPLVGQMVREAIGKPTSLDADPKFAIALGAAVTCELRDDASLEPVATARAEPASEAAAVTSSSMAPAARSPMPPPGTRVPLPVRVAHEDLLVGRDTELAALDDAIKGVRSESRRRIVLVSGEPGMGKTSLTSAFARAAYDDGITVLYGRCDEDLGVPYQPWIEALDHLVTHTPDSVLDQLEPRHIGDLSRLLPHVHQRRPDAELAPSSNPESERYLLYNAVSALLTAAGQEEPVLVVLDDLHWADKPTLELLRLLDADAPVLVLATFRDSDVTDQHPLADTLATLHRDSSAERLALRGLGDVDVVRLLESVAGHEMDDRGIALAHSVRAEADGNPFFTGELIRHLAETGTIYQDQDGRWVANSNFDPHELPVSVREVIGRRVSRLGDDVRQVLQTAAVIGRDFDLSLLAEALERDEDSVLDVLDQAVATSLVAESQNAVGRFTFVHALIQHTLYSDVAPTRRARAHRRVAEALEKAGSIDDHLGELAHHWGAAVTQVDIQKALDYARRAGHRALTQLAPDEAVRWYTQGLDLGAQHSIDERTRAEMLVGLGDAQRQIGDAGFLDTLLEAGALARALGDSVLLARAALATDRGWFGAVGEVIRPLVELLESALEAVDDVDSDERARLLALLAQELHYHPDQQRRSDLVDEALAMARRLGNDATIVYCLCRACAALWTIDQVERRLGYGSEAARLTEGSDDPVARYWALNALRAAALDMGDRDTFDQTADEQRAVADEVGQPSLLWRTKWNDTGLAMLDADHDVAEVLLNEQLELGTAAGYPDDAFTVYSGMISVLRWQQGRYDELLELIAQAVADNPGVAAFRAALADAHADTGSLDTAAEMVREEVARTGFEINFDTTWSLALSVWADAAVLVGDAQACGVLYDLLAPYAGYLACTSPLFASGIDHTLGALARVLGRYEEAGEHLTAAQEFHDRLRAPFHRARTHLEQALNLRDRGRPEDSAAIRDHAEQAVDLARAHGCAAVERRAAAFLESLA